MINPTPDTAGKVSPRQMLVVGIGASAGGMEALTEFFEHVPAHTGLAYLIMLHLSPDQNVQLADLLTKVAKLPVKSIAGTEKIVADHIYILPAAKHFELEKGRVTVGANAPIEDRRAPVDLFFRMLAESYKERSIAVILSGTGANGSMGLKRIKEYGGATFVQNPREAAFNEMPRNAIATELVDNILPVAQIPAQLLSYREGLGTVAIAVESEIRPPDQQQALREVFTQLRMRTGHDFSNYKRPTLMRRIERRINVLNLPNLPAYVAYMREQPDETQALLKNLLISVTNFFRDNRAFQAIEQEVLPLLIKGKNQEHTLRIWVAGCATGEEAYSLAMLCAEKTFGVLDAPKIQIFATDIDEAALSIAREGKYNINDTSDVTPERLRRFFTRDGNEYRIRREIREMVLFARHNVLKDPPFSQLDLVTCRNMLIYLNQTAQERAMETFHFALKPGAYLWLGMSETVDGSSDLYVNVSRENHLYQSRQVSSRSYPVPETIPQFIPEKRSITQPAPELDVRSGNRMSFGDLHQQLLEQYAPPSIIVNEEYEILHLTERAGRFLHIAGGEPSKNLLKLIRPELRLELRTAFYQAVQQQTNVEARNLKIRMDDQTETVTIHVRPVLREGDPARGFILVLFQQMGDTNEQESVLAAVEPMARHLEEELVRVKAQLRTSNEQHEVQAEELKASNEELQAINEELRSAAEELETSKEELQSINEELTTINQELKVKVDEISLTSNNLQNLINSTNMATLFLDRGLRVNLFTPATREIFNLITADFGRPLSDITNRLDYAHLQQDAELVLDKLQTVEREVKSTDGRVFMMRILPYRTAEDRINGVVLTFVDITGPKAAEEALREADRRKDEFLAMLAHELRNPLAPVRNTLQIMKMTSGDDERVSTSVAMMNRQVDHLVRLVDDLLDVSRISRGKIELRREQVELGALVTESVEATSALYQSGNRHLTLTLPENPLYLNGDATRLTQVVTNLLTNGVRFTQVNGRVWVTLVQTGTEILLTVKDDGIGLTSDQFEAIFELFAQVDSSPKRPDGGLGLGLTLVKQLVEMHGGRVEARSNGLGRGSEFLVYFPYLEVPVEFVPPSIERTLKPAARNILVVDDNRDAADTLALVLRHQGHRANVSYAGQEALGLLESQPTDIVLMDISMPQMDGFETARQIRNRPDGSKIAIIALTGYGQSDDKKRTRQAGFDGHLVKPIDLGELNELLNQLFADKDQGK
ncbi:two-component system, chemotaxis family, CheB/CheR fusion protein [Dyadobacter soli]|uniref:Two-component system, chemotaxis family, CheB/CheR fusion protein n=1 Tax=Dyadobacter soli TaxID=659014 RepID=A0A1G7D032_9BACT|nr:CheR family methyltransferase [Dyadobacter soli]SDE44881.1 two-component system, chemotaxis family, CheB/CheR fusion protein [Dyadobacter soli]